MSNLIQADYSKQLLFPPSIEDYLSEDDPVRFLREFIDSLDLKELGFEESEGEIGRPAYSVNLLLKVVIYGCFEGIRSFRSLERQCKRDVGLIWLTGMHYPDHNSIWRFYKKNKKSIKGIFQQSVKVALKNDLIGMLLNAVDGTRIKADVSDRNKISRKKLEGILSELDNIGDKLIEDLDRNNQTEIGEEENKLPKELQDREKLRKKIQDDLKELADNEATQMHKTDKDARTMRFIGNQFALGYNCQIGVDSTKGIITSAETGQNAADSVYFGEMIEQSKLNTDGQTAETTVADAGYFSGKNLVDKGYEVLINIPSDYNQNKFIDKDSPYYVKNFDYDKQRDVYKCPQEKDLTFRRYQKGYNGSNYLGKIYKCSDYANCPVVKECTKLKDGRQICVNVHHQIIEQQKIKQQGVLNKDKLKKRREIVEPVFGYIKNILNYRRATLRGLENVKSQWYLICTIINLRKIHKALYA